MTTMILALTGPVHTGSCVAIPRAVAALAARAGRRLAEPPVMREYCLHDQRGRPVGVIRASDGRPRVGRFEPTVYLERRF
jgi:hypothetical protein